MPDQHRQTVQRCQFAGQRLQLPLAGVHESRAQQQVFGRIAGQCQLRCDHQRRAAGMRVARGSGDLAGVAREIADRRVDLRQRDADLGRHVERRQVDG